MAYAFTTQGATPNSPQGSTPNPSGGTSAARALNSAQGIAPPPLPLVPPMPSNNGPVKSHSITHPDGTVVTQTFHNPEQGMLSKGKPATSTPKTAPQSAAPAPTPMPAMKIINGEHHIPFKGADGSVKFINAKGEIS